MNPYDAGQQYAYDELGMTQPGTVGFAPGYYPTPESSGGMLKFLRRVGPLAGGVGGSIASLLMTRGKDLNLLQRLGPGFLAGSSVGWIPEGVGQGLEALNKD